MLLLSGIQKMRTNSILCVTLNTTCYLCRLAGGVLSTPKITKTHRNKLQSQIFLQIAEKTTANESFFFLKMENLCGVGMQCN